MTTYGFELHTAKISSPVPPRMLGHHQQPNLGFSEDIKHPKAL